MKLSEWKQARDSPFWHPMTVDQFGILTKEGARAAREELKRLAEHKKAVAAAKRGDAA